MLGFPPLRKLLGLDWGPPLEPAPSPFDQQGHLEVVADGTKVDRDEGQKDQRTRRGFGLRFAGIQQASAVGTVDLGNTDSVRAAVRGLHARLAIQGAFDVFERPLLRDAALFLANAGIEPSRTITRAIELAKDEKAAVEEKKSERRLEKANERLAPYGIRMTLSQWGTVSVHAILDDVPQGLTDVVQAHRKQQPRPETAGGWLEYPSAYGLTFVTSAKDEERDVSLLEADGKTIAATIPAFEMSPTHLRLSGYSGARNGWDGYDLETALVAKLLAENPKARSIELELMEDTPDFAAFRSAGGGRMAGIETNRAAVMSTPLVKALERFARVTVDFKEYGTVEPTKWIHDNPDYAAIVLRLDRD